MLTKIIIAVLCLLSLPIVLIIGAFIMNDLPWSDAPGPVSRLMHYLTTNVAETVQDSPYPELIIREYHYPVEKFYPLLVTSVTNLGWEIHGKENRLHTLHAVATTSLIGYKDDIHIKLIPSRASRTQLYVRSNSREGRGDLGTNTRHILDLYHQIEQMADK